MFCLCFLQLLFSVRLTEAVHSVRDAAQLPFDRTFTEEYPEFMNREDLARGYQAWAERYCIVCSLNQPLNTSLTSTEYFILDGALLGDLG